MNKWMKVVCFCMLCLLLAGCSSSPEKQTQKELDTGFIPARAGMYDSVDTALIKQINKRNNTIVFYNFARQKNYTLNFDGTTAFYDKYGGALTIDQVHAGDIANIRFLKEKKALALLQRSDETFVLENVKNFTINEKTHQMMIGDQTYRLEDNLFVYSDGEQVEIMDINQVDTLRVQGIGHTIYSVCIDKGHGYLRLKNDEYFWGGWIEVGGSVIQRVKEDMLLVVPEGKYDVLLTNNGISGSKRVTINRDKETELDIGDMKKEEDKKQYGNLIFVVSPDTANVYIDGKEVDISLPVQAEYGIHQLMAKAEGYQTVIQYIKVGQENATIQIEMEVDNGDSVSTNSTTSSDDAVSTTSGKITIDAPKDVEVYVDGSYIGMAPCSFKKTEGVHVITLRKTGYVTKSYTINITNTETNENMSFSALVKEEDDEKESETKDESTKEESSEDEKESGGSDDKDKDDSDDKDKDDEDEDSEDGTTVLDDEFPG